MSDGGSRNGGRTRRRSGRRLKGDRFAQASFWILTGLFAFCAAGGGSSRADVPSLLFVRPAAILAIAAFMALPGAWDIRPVKLPMLGLAAMAILMLIQLVPLPPVLWTALPAHARFAAASGLIGASQPWAPISLTPDLVWSSLFDLIVPAAVLIGYARLGRIEHGRLLDVLVALIAIAVLVAVIQVGSGSGYLYRLTSYGLPVGLFANRNHQATLLAVSLPVLRLWAMAADKTSTEARLRLAVAVALAILIVPLVMLGGSRSGLFLLVVMAVAAGLIPGLPSTKRDRKRALIFLGGSVALLASIGLLTVIAGQSLAISRLAEADVMADQRSQAGPVVWRIVRDFVPWGSGFGSFDRVFRIYEPDALLTGTYFNHAHNDFIELVLTGGIPATLILAMFILWWGHRSWAGIRARPYGGREPQTILLARLGTVVTLGIGLASLVDYPLRTPLMAAVFALGCAWLGSLMQGPIAPQSAEELPRQPALPV